MFKSKRIGIKIKGENKLQIPILLHITELKKYLTLYFKNNIRNIRKNIRKFKSYFFLLD